MFPLYVASKNGNYDVVSLLLKLKANPYQTFILNNDIQVQAIEMAVRWNHINIVQLFIDQIKYKKQYIKKLITLVKTKAIKDILEKQLGNKKGKGILGCFRLYKNKNKQN